MDYDTVKAQRPMSIIKVLEVVKLIKTKRIQEKSLEAKFCFNLEFGEI